MDTIETTCEPLGRATYSPEDNKLRIYPHARLSKEDYLRVKAAGFGWAPKQELFVAPAWTPEREDLAILFCGEIEDEDKTLVERAGERSERFEDYSAKRMDDANGARDAVSRIADGIPLGQPILVGHHSERHARRDAEKIENGMRRAVKMWETSKYWADRAQSAIGSAKYKEEPSVRARRIKGLEADLRKYLRSGEPRPLDLWDFKLIDADGNILRNEQGKVRLDKERLAAAKAERAALIRELGPRMKRWIAHTENRLTYEREMLAASGGTVADKTGPEKGGACRCWASPPSGWSIIQKVNRISVTLLDNWGNGGNDFTRVIPFDKLKAVMTKAQVEDARSTGRVIGETLRGFGLLNDAPPVVKVCACHRGSTCDISHDPATCSCDQCLSAGKRADFDAMKDSLKAGVKVVSAPQLFPTPKALVEQMIDLAVLEPHLTILEPSAGTGNIVRDLYQSTGVDVRNVMAVEINRDLCTQLASAFPEVRVRHGDFLALDNLGTFDRVLMNPPFENGADIKHIKHALKVLKPGGRLVAICANGPRQRAALEPISEEWIDLPDSSFSDQGTEVRTAIVVITNI